MELKSFSFEASFSMDTLLNFFLKKSVLRVSLIEFNYL